MTGETDIQARFDAAIADYQRGEHARAAELFASVLADAPEHPVALRLRGLALVRAGDARAALPLLARARKLAPEEPLTHMHHGIGLQQAGKHARAAALFRRAAMMMPDNPAPWVNFSAALVSLGQNKAARAAARRAIKRAPGAPEGFHALGIAERAEGDFSAARDAFSRALTLDRRLPQIWVDFGLACYQLGDPAAAEAAMREALRAKPRHPAAQTNLAAFVLLRGDTDAAIALLRELLDQDQNYAPARLNLANILLLDNEPVGALALLEGAPPVGRDGKHWRAQRAMALLMIGRRAEARAELDAIEQPYGDAEILILWRRMALPPQNANPVEADAMAARMAELAASETAAVLEHRVIAHYDLARYFHRRGDTNAAFANWERGHRLLARMQPFSRDTFRAFIDASISHYDGDRLRNGPRAGNTDPTPVFIVGLPRSGTSLTEQILAAHPRVHGAGERPAIHRLLNELAGGAEIAGSVPRAALLDAEALGRAGEKYLAELRALAPDARYITDKMPGNARHLGFISLLLPGSKIIHCRRDPRDIGISIFQHRFFGHHPYAHDLSDLGWTIGQHERLMAHWRAVLPVPMIEVALEDWIADFSGTLARLLDFLGLPHDPACERFFEHDRRVRTASARQVRRPINNRGLGRWRDYARQLQPMFEELRAAGVLHEDE
jgi:Flp pilus assembly protein TadD